MKTIASATFLGTASNVVGTTTKSGIPMTTFTMTTIKSINGEDKPLYHSIVAYNKSAELLCKFLRDGKIVYLDCEISKAISHDEKYQFIVKTFAFV
jgi:hypothetical protein